MVKRVVHTRETAKVYHVSLDAGKVVEKVLPAEKIDNEMRYLQIAIDKTADTAELEAWGWLQEAIATHRGAARGFRR